MPPELDLKTIEGMKITDKTVQKLGEYFIEHAPKITDAEVADYYRVGGEILKEVAPERNAMLHSRIGGHRDDGKLVLVRMRVSDQISDELALISSGWLDEMIERMDERRIRLETVRPPLEMKA